MTLELPLVAPATQLGRHGALLRPLCCQRHFHRRHFHQATRGTQDTCFVHVQTTKPESEQKEPHQISAMHFSNKLSVLQQGYYRNTQSLLLRMPLFRPLTHENKLRFAESRVVRTRKFCGNNLNELQRDLCADKVRKLPTPLERFLVDKFAQVCPELQSKVRRGKSE